MGICMTTFTNEFNILQQDVYNTAAKNGFCDDPISDERALLLIVGEVAEATEALRRPVMEQDHHIPEFTELEAELADVVLRCMNYAHARNLRLAEAIEAKAAYNKTRPFKHGGKKF
jgi:NTP pyrophosphatase (non-canonical NTP hydrolase)